METVEKTKFNKKEYNKAYLEANKEKYNKMVEKGIWNAIIPMQNIVQK